MQLWQLLSLKHDFLKNDDVIKRKQENFLTFSYGRATFWTKLSQSRLLFYTLFLIFGVALTTFKIIIIFSADQEHLARPFSYIHPKHPCAIKGASTKPNPAINKTFSSSRDDTAAKHAWFFTVNLMACPSRLVNQDV